MNTPVQQQFVRDFLTESHEGLDRFDAAVVQLERHQAGSETLHDVFRIVHTIKGTSGCLGFHQVEKLAHAGEALLDQLRDGRLAPTSRVASVLLQLSAALRELLQRIEHDGTDAATTDPTALLAELEACQTGGPAPEPTAAWGLFDDAPAAPEAAPAPTPAAAPVAAGAASTSVRVDVALLDKLMNLVGELVLSRNQLVQAAHGRQLERAAVTAISQRLNLVTTELQEGVMKTRMQPIGNVWSKFPRVVRDVAHELGKSVRLETVGAETELDRTIIEAIRDPLTHIVRNAIDHGIESAEARAAAGKPAEGLIVMRAFHEGGQVNIEIVDDGAGIALARVREKAVEKGLISAEQAARLSERDALNLIFLPGFSTARAVTRVSGRGVGMDVVKTNVEKIGGSVDVHSVPGRGTTLKIKIPLTLAIVPALIVKSGGERFAIPQVNLLELVRLDGAADAARIENVGEAPVFRLRGHLLPLLFLDRELGLASAGSRDGVTNIVVLQADKFTYGLVVDTVCDTEEIVVKPLGKQLKRLPMYAGATIMGDGCVALILDALGLAQSFRAEVQAMERAAGAGPDANEAARDANQLLLFSVPGRANLAMPLALAARLEEFTLEHIERSGRHEAVQYRGRIMPLLRLDRLLAGAADPAAPADGPLRVIVYQHQGRFAGLVVGQIHDIVDQTGTLQHDTPAAGLLGSTVVNGRIVDLIDVPNLLETAGVAA